MLRGKIRLSSKSIKKCSFNVNHIPSKVDGIYDLTVSTDSGVKISVDSACEICVKCRIDSSNTELNELLVLEFNRSSEASSSKRTIKRLAALVSMRTGKAVFGVPYKDLELCEKSGIPKVLEMCKSELFKSGGADVVGIFRKAAEKHRMDEMKIEMNNGTYKLKAPHADVNCMANLIKIWFREMSNPILSMESSKFVLKLESTDDCVALSKRIQEPNRTLLLWCVDMFVSIVQNEPVNKMNAKNCAIVMAPNLVGKDKTDPTSGGMKAIMMLQKAVFFLGELIKRRLNVQIFNLYILNFLRVCVVIFNPRKISSPPVMYKLLQLLRVDDFNGTIFGLHKTSVGVDRKKNSGFGSIHFSLSCENMSAFWCENDQRS